MSEPVSQREYARMRGVSHQAVQKAIASGRISALPDGRVDPETASREWAENTIGSANLRPNGARRKVTAAEAQAALISIKVQLAMIELRRQQGLYVEAARITRDLANVARTIRDQLLPIGARIARQVAATLDPDECQEIIDREIKSALRELASLKHVVPDPPAQEAAS